MSRVLAQQFICNFNKFSQKSIKDAKHPMIVSLHDSRYINALDKRFCHISNVATQVNSNHVDNSKSLHLQSKILHAARYETNGEVMV